MRILFLRSSLLGDYGFVIFFTGHTEVIKDALLITHLGSPMPHPISALVLG